MQLEQLRTYDTRRGGRLVRRKNQQQQQQTTNLVRHQGVQLGHRLRGHRERSVALEVRPVRSADDLLLPRRIIAFTCVDSKRRRGTTGSKTKQEEPQIIAQRLRISSVVERVRSQVFCSVRGQGSLCLLSLSLRCLGERGDICLEKRKVWNLKGHTSPPGKKRENIPICAFHVACGGQKYQAPKDGNSFDTHSA